MLRKYKKVIIAVLAIGAAALTAYNIDVSAELIEQIAEAIATIGEAE